jgi:hypothetical protein
MPAPLAATYQSQALCRADLQHFSQVQQPHSESHVASQSSPQIGSHSSAQSSSYPFEHEDLHRSVQSGSHSTLQDDSHSSAHSDSHSTAHDGSHSSPQADSASSSLSVWPASDTGLALIGGGRGAGFKGSAANTVLPPSAKHANAIPIQSSLPDSRLRNMFFTFPWQPKKNGWENGARKACQNYAHRWANFATAADRTMANSAGKTADRPSGHRFTCAGCTGHARANDCMGRYRRAEVAACTKVTDCAGRRLSVVTIVTTGETGTARPIRAAAEDSVASGHGRRPMLGTTR